jgi:hypothetical protein
MHEETFFAGQRVKDIFGVRHTVLFQRGCQVFFTNGDWAHPAKVFAA